MGRFWRRLRLMWRRDEVVRRSTNPQPGAAAEWEYELMWWDPGNATLSIFPGRRKHPSMKGPACETNQYAFESR